MDFILNNTNRRQNDAFDRFYMNFGTHTGLRFQDLLSKKNITTTYSNSYINNSHNSKKHQQLKRLARSSFLYSNQKSKQHNNHLSSNFSFRGIRKVNIHYSKMQKQQSFACPYLFYKKNKKKQYFINL